MKGLKPVNYQIKAAQRSHLESSESFIDSLGWFHLERQITRRFRFYLSRFIELPPPSITKGQRLQGSFSHSTQYEIAFEMRKKDWKAMSNKICVLLVADELQIFLQNENLFKLLIPFKYFIFQQLDQIRRKNSKQKKESQAKKKKLWQWTETAQDRNSSFWAIHDTFMNGSVKRSFSPEKQKISQ